MMMLDILIGLGLIVVGALCWAAGYKVGQLTKPSQPKGTQNGTT